MAPQLLHGIWRYCKYCSTCAVEFVLTLVWHALVNLCIRFQTSPPLPKLISRPHFPTYCVPVDILLRVNIQKCDSGQAVSVNLRVTDHTYLLMRVFVSVSRHQILLSFTFHLSLHWSCVWVLSIRSNTAFQNLGVLAGILPSSSIACITWSKRTTLLQSMDLCHCQQSMSHVLWWGAYWSSAYHRAPGASEISCDMQKQNVPERRWSPPRSIVDRQV